MLWRSGSNQLHVPAVQIHVKASAKNKKKRHWCHWTGYRVFVRSQIASNIISVRIASTGEDNFYGPVSTSFLKRDLLDSQASDENHDHTMDSTAFSMHFRSIARSDSEGELRTSTGVHLSFEVKTPTLSSLPSNTGNSMVMTLPKKQYSELDVSTSKVSIGSQSNDMSLVGEYHHKYDYGKLSPTLNALLAEGSKDLHMISTPYISMLKSPTKGEKHILATKESGSDQMDISYCQDTKLERVTSQEMVDEDISVKDNDGSKLFPSMQIACDVSSNTPDTQASKLLSADQSIRVTPTSKTKEPFKDAFEIKSREDLLATGQDTSSNPKSIGHQLDDIMEKENRSPLVGSITYSNNNPSHLLLNGAILSKSPGTVTPTYNQASVFPRTESLKHGGSLSSLRKSISKLRILEASPFSAVLNARLEDSNSRLLVSLSKMTPLGTSLERNSNTPQANCMKDIRTETLDTYLEESLQPADQQKRERVSTNLDDNRIDVPVTCNKNFSDAAPQLASLSENTESGTKDTQPNLLNSPDNRHGYEDDENKTGSKWEFNSSPRKKLEAATAAEFKVSSYRDGKQAIQHNTPLKFGLGHVAGSEENTNTSLSTASPMIDSLDIERRESSSPLHFAVSNLEEMVHNRKDFLYDTLCNPETRGNFTTLSQDKKHENFQLSSTESDMPMGGKKASLALHASTDEQSCHEDLVDQFSHSLSNYEVSDVSNNGRNGSLVKENIQSSANRLSNVDVSSVERKRKTEDGMIEKIARIKRSPNHRKDCVSGSELLSGIGLLSTGPNPKHSVEIRTSFFKETQLFPRSVDKINLHGIDCLVDILGQLQRSKTYELLSTQFMYQKNIDPGSNIQHERAETKLLLCKLLHEQAKLQLMRVKRERLLKSVQSLSSGIQKSEALKLNCSPQNSLGVQVVHCQPFLDNVDIQECQVEGDKVTSMGQALTDINRKISNLTKSFHKSCKMKGGPNSTETIAFVSDQLRKRACCQIIRKDMQLWVLDNLECSRDRHVVVLNYLDLMTQRLTVTGGQVRSVSISNKLNEMTISKKFKDMDASIAFRFVSSAGLTKKHFDATSLAHETQMTSSLLGNLVDVMEEIQLATLELQNLIYARFHRSSDEHLDLELSFFDSKSRKKATVTLNTSCLKSGIYPSEIVPSRIESLNPSSPSLSSDITAAVQDLRAGFSRIQRLCRCVSQLISSSR